MSVFALSCFVLFGCLLSEEKTEGDWMMGGADGCRGAGRSREKKNCGWDGLCEKGIYFQ